MKKLGSARKILLLQKTWVTAKWTQIHKDFMQVHAWNHGIHAWSRMERKQNAKYFSLQIFEVGFCLIHVRNIVPTENLTTSLVMKESREEPKNCRRLHPNSIRT